MFADELHRLSPLVIYPTHQGAQLRTVQRADAEQKKRSSLERRLKHLHYLKQSHQSQLLSKLTLVSSTNQQAQLATPILRR